MIIVLKCWTSLYRIYRFINPSKMRKAAETDVPIMPPIVLKVPNFELMAEAVAATIIEVMTTILGI